MPASAGCGHFSEEMKEKQSQQNTDLSALETILGYTFRDRGLLLTALTHTSFVKGDGRHAQHNERMEFLGDAVLELIVSEHLYTLRTDMQEGQMTRARARLVCEQALFSAACELGLPPFLRLGHGEETTGGRDKPSVVSDALEAVIGGVFLDGGMEAAKGLVLGRIIKLLEEAHVDSRDKDFKTRLQEYIQKDHLGALSYELAGTRGPEHSKVFLMRVLLSGRELGIGEGATKQAAGQAAAYEALKSLGAEKEEPVCD